MRAHSASQRSAADAAVTAPVSTALTIAIAIALAVAVFFFVHVLGKPREEASSIGMQLDEGRDSLTYIQSSLPVDLSKVRMTLSVAGHYGYNEEATASTAAVGSSGVALSATPGATFQAGDYLAFCGDAFAEHVTVMFIQDSDDTLLLQRTFETLAAC